MSHLISFTERQFLPFMSRRSAGRSKLNRAQLKFMVLSASGCAGSSKWRRQPKRQHHGFQTGRVKGSPHDVYKSAKFGQADQREICLRAAKMPRIRSKYD